MFSLPFPFSICWKVEGNIWNGRGCFIVWFIKIGMKNNEKDEL